MSTKNTDSPASVVASYELPGTDLSDADYEMLAQSWIDRDLAIRAGLRRVSDLEGSAILGRTSVKHCAGVLFPHFWPGENHAREFRIRLDDPPMDIVVDSKPKPRYKYLSPQQARPLLYFPPDTDPAWLEDTSVPIIFCEGEKKALSLGRLAVFGRDSTQPPRWLAIGIAGVWSWRGTVEIFTNAQGKRVPVKGLFRTCCEFDGISAQFTFCLTATSTLTITSWPHGAIWRPSS